MDKSSLDFQQASIKLVLFKSQLRSVLYGVRQFEEALLSPDGNPFGEWLTMVGRPRYGSQGLRAVEQAHRLLLQTANDLIRRYQRGELEAARGYMTQIDAVANQIMNLLGKLESNPIQHSV